ncbi:hypothetical protein [Paraburkholderia hospita]|jgi:hypothetical protein|uniref:hypothetical protein n=1 Tax=Paraburkholderia hospita TaxID=169430 RepID=UPI0002E50B20|nr:hypothetical protein [Paraburkholderia hospita]
MVGAAGLDWKATTWLTLAFMRRHLQFHGLATEGIDRKIVWIRKQTADDQAASSTDAGT